MRLVDSGQARRSDCPPGPGQCRDMLLIGKARHRIIGLRFERPAHQPALGMDAEHRQRIFAALRRDAGGEREMLHERGDENRLTRA